MENDKKPEFLLQAILEALSVGPCCGTEIENIVDFFQNRLILDENEAAVIGTDMSNAVESAIEMGKQLGLVRNKNGKISLAISSYKKYFKDNDDDDEQS